MKIGLCYETVLPRRGGCETYIADLTRRLARDGHAVTLFCCRWDEALAGDGVTVRRLPHPGGPRFLRPWRFAEACRRALAGSDVDVSVGFDKTWGQDVLYPQGGLHSASAHHNLLKHPPGWRRSAARLLKAVDPAAWSFRRLEARQYLGPDRPLVVVNSRMVRGHFETFLGVPGESLRVVHSAIDPERFRTDDRPRVRQEARAAWRLAPGEVAGLFLATNYRLKGLAPLLDALALVPASSPLRLVVAGNDRDGAYRRQAARLGVADRVRFVGYCGDARAAYFGADLLVHPTFYDPCSLVVLEALACGLPVVTSRYNGASELLHAPHDGAVVADPHDPVELSEAVQRLCDGPRRAEASRAARKTALGWTWEHHYQKLTAVFAEAARRKRRAG